MNPTGTPEPEATVAHGLHRIEALAGAIGDELDRLADTDGVVLEAVRGAVGAIKRHVAAATAALGRLIGDREVLERARGQWKPLARTCAEITFINVVGDIVAVPEVLVRQLARDENLAATVHVDGSTLVFMRGQRRWAVLPKSLAASLREVMAGYPWPTESGSSTPVGSV